MSERMVLALSEDCSAGSSTLDAAECVDVPPSLEHLPEDVLLALMHRLDGCSLACFGRTAKPVHAASSQIPPLIFASRGRLVVFNAGSHRHDHQRCGGTAANATVEAGGFAC